MRLLLISITFLFVACSNGNPTEKQLTQQATTQQAARLIISFTDPDINPEDPQLIQTLAKDLQGEIKFVRSLSGNATLYLCETKESDEELTTRLNKLGERDDITYAERDHRHKPQTSKK